MLLKSLSIITLFSLGSCTFEGKGVLNSQVSVGVVSQFRDSFLRTSSGRPYIRLQGQPGICRFRPFSQGIVREELLNSGVSEDVLNDYFFGGGGVSSSEEETASSNEEETDSSNEEIVSEPIFYTIGDNWIEFGLLIENNTDFALVINKVRLNGVGRCGGKTFNYSDEKNSGYCSGGGFPILYLIPPRQKIEYNPENTNPFHNLKLYFDGFPIEDRRGENSRRLQNLANRDQPAGNITNTAEEVCEPSSDDWVIPAYQLELSLSGYFIGLSSEYVTLDFFKRVNFSTEVL